MGLQVFVFLLTLISLNTYSNFLLLNKFYEQYPDFKESQYSCTVCHKIPGGPLNPYGIDARKNRFKFELIEEIDSDEDGFINIEEIEFLTNPGEKSSFPDSL